MQAYERRTWRQDRESCCKRTYRRVSLCHRDIWARMDCQHGKNHESLSSKRQLHDFLHGFKENYGDQPQELNYSRAPQQSWSRCQREDSKRFDLAYLWDLFVNFRLCSRRFYIFRQQNPSYDQTWPIYRRRRATRWWWPPTSWWCRRRDQRKDGGSRLSSNKVDLTLSLCNQRSGSGMVVKNNRELKFRKRSA